MNGYNTNLAAEFHVLSALHRLGADATLTLGNKKSVDIVVVHEAGNHTTIDVKGLAGTTGWPVDNFRSGGLARHFLVLVCFCGKIDDLERVPEVYVVPAKEVETLTYFAPGGTRKIVQVSTMRNGKGKQYKSAWGQLCEENRHGVPSAAA